MRLHAPTFMIIIFEGFWLYWDLHTQGNKNGAELNWTESIVEQNNNARDERGWKKMVKANMELGNETY